MKKVVIDAGSATLFGNRTFLSGVGRTTIELIKALENTAHPDLRIELFIQRLRGDGLSAHQLKSKLHWLRLPRRRELEPWFRRLPVVETFTGADLMHIPHNYAPVKRLPATVLTIHDAIFLTCFESHLHCQRDIGNILEMGKRVGKVITCSESSKRDLVKFGGLDPDKIKVISWGYDRTVFHAADDDNQDKAVLAARYGITRPYLFSVSCSVGRKRTPELIDAYLALAEQGYEYDLALVWSSPPPAVQAAVAASPAGSRVHLLNSVDDLMLARLYRQATATVFPSIYEGFGLPVLESMACGTPVITTRCSSLPEIGGDAAIYLDSPEASAISPMLERLGNQGLDLADLRLRGLERAKLFSWERCAGETLDVYRSLLL